MLMRKKTTGIIKSKSGGENIGDRKIEKRNIFS